MNNPTEPQSETPEDDDFPSLLSKGIGEAIRERNALRAQVATLTRERDDALANKKFGWETAREASAQYEKEHTELLALRREAEQLREDKARSLVHLGNMLDEVIVTKRGDWPRDLFCIECGTCVSKQQPHKQSCKIGHAGDFWDAAMSRAVETEEKP